MNGFVTEETKSAASIVIQNSLANSIHCEMNEYKQPEVLEAIAFKMILNQHTTLVYVLYNMILLGCFLQGIIIRYDLITDSPDNNEIMEPRTMCLSAIFHEPKAIPMNMNNKITYMEGYKNWYQTQNPGNR